MLQKRDDLLLGDERNPEKCAVPGSVLRQSGLFRLEIKLYHVPCGLYQC